jgi:hypothetical protein
MKTRRRTVTVLAALLAATVAAVFPASSRAQDHKPDQSLHITRGGSVLDHPDRGKLVGVCGTDPTREVLICDISNGLLDWTVTQVVLTVSCSPCGANNTGYYRAPVAIEPLKTERVSVTLGLQLPPDKAVGATAVPDWGWLIVSARGYRAQ